MADQGDTQDDGTFGPAELDALFGTLLHDGQRFALAVSGGSDSTALMVLVAEWLDHARRDTDTFTVLTVDHRLRPQSAEEASAVAAQASSRGLRHATLVWDGEKPAAGIQAAARSARYRLMGDYARAHGIDALVTAHTADDQAETLLMRLARGSGLDGLSAMAPASALQDGSAPGAATLRVVRPLLGMTKARLQSALTRRGVGWIEDPSNVSPAFERVRLRGLRSGLYEAGLTDAMLGLSARRLQRARTALERWVGDLLDPASGIVAVHPCGFFGLDVERLRTLPEEIVVRILGHAIAKAGGSADPVPMAGLEAISAELLSGAGSAWTLARAKLSVADGRLLVEREPGRGKLPQLVLGAGDATVWDGRYRVAADTMLGEPVELRALGVEGLRVVREIGDVPDGVPVGSLRALPSFWRGDQLLAVPPLGVWPDPRIKGHVTAIFAPSIGAGTKA